MPFDRMTPQRRRALLSAHEGDQAMHRRRVLQALGSGAGLLAAPRLARSARADTLVFVPQADLAALDPVWVTAYVTRNHAFLVYDTLYGIDEAYQPQPQMLEGHVVAEDGRRWTLTLREGLLFHDGAPVLARDAVASIRRWASRDAFGGSLLAVTDELSAPDDRTILFRLKKPFPALPFAMGRGSNTMLPILPERLAATPATQQITDPTGSGPYRFVADERVSGSRAVYQRFDRYTPRPGGTSSFTAGPKLATLERIEWRTIPDAATAAAALQAGEVDWWEQPTPDLLPLLRRNRAIRTEVIDRAGNIGFLRVNSLLPPFDNPAVKRALLGAIYQPDFMAAVVGENPDLFNPNPAGVFTPGTPLAVAAGLDGLVRRPDYDRVKRDLAAAGYRGETVTMLGATDFPAINALCEVSADTMRKAGLNLDYQAMDWGTVTSRRNNQDVPARGGWNAHCTYTAGYDLLNPGSNPSLNAIGRGGFVGWPTDPEMAALRSAWFDATDLDAQRRICADIQARFLQNPPYFPLGQFFSATAYRAGVTNIPRGSFSLFWGVRKG
jgi:peptide/nickel transport system substrate-binding protein